MAIHISVGGLPSFNIEVTVASGAKSRDRMTNGRIKLDLTNISIQIVQSFLLIRNFLSYCFDLSSGIC